MNIAEVSLVRLEGALDPAWHWAGEKDTVHPLHRFEEFRRRPDPPPGHPVPIVAYYVEIMDTDGAVGRYGPLYEEPCLIIARRLRPLLIGRAVEPADDLWDLMFRSDRHLQTGLGMMAISAVDNALWDLRGKAAGVPVCRLLSDTVRAQVPAYRSINDYPYEPEAMAAFARQAMREGYRHLKWFLRHGPAGGDVGRDTDARMVRTVREAVGQEARLMFDCFMSWDLDQARRMVPVLMEASPLWIEELFPPRRLDDVRAIHREFPGAPLATGEHLYTRWEVKPFLDEGLLAVVQCDPDWCGGITELVRICDLAERHGVPVVPHGHTIAAAIQVVAARTETACPLVEVLPRHQVRMQWFQREPVTPHHGRVTTPTAPGLGIEWNPERITARRDVFPPDAPP